MPTDTPEFAGSGMK